MISLAIFKNIALKKGFKAISISKMRLFPEIFKQSENKLFIQFKHLVNAVKSF